MNKTLTHSIGALMEREGLNVSELAVKIGVPKPTLHKIVAGHSARPHSKTLTAISKHFKISVAQLLNGEIDGYSQANKIKNVPIINWNDIDDWINGKINKKDCQQTTPVNVDISEKSFALVINDINSMIFRPNSILLFDPVLKVRDGVYVLVKLAEHPDVLLRQIVCDVSNTKYLKSLNQEFSASTRKLESKDKLIAVLLMAKTLFYHT